MRILPSGSEARVGSTEGEGKALASGVFAGRALITGAGVGLSSGDKTGSARRTSGSGRGEEGSWACSEKTTPVRNRSKRRVENLRKGKKITILRHGIRC
jgi:hypothetical protein